MPEESTPRKEMIPALAAKWDEPVNGERLLDDLRGVFSRYLYLPEGAATALALWTVHTYAIDATDIFPIISALSPQKRCGKTTLLRVLKGLVRQPVLASHFTKSSIYRLIEQYRPTLLIDEADTYLKTNHELIGILNSGHTRDGQVVVNVRDDPTSDWTPKIFATWSPKSIAAIGNLPETLADRSIIIALHRRPKAVTLLKYDSTQDDESAVLRRKIVRWVSDHIETLRSHKPQSVESLNDRSADNWSTLLAIAEVAGGRWAQRARAAAFSLSASIDDRLSVSEMLLVDFRTILDAAPNSHIRTAHLLEALENLGDRPWADFHGRGRGLTPVDLGNELRPYGIRSVKIRFGEKTYWGYAYDNHTREIFERYAPIPEQAEQSEQPKPEGDNVPDVPDVPGNPEPRRGTINLRTSKVNP